jgi:hypothetical protein
LLGEPRVAARCMREQRARRFSRTAHALYSIALVPTFHRPPARPPLFARPPRVRQAVANRASRPWIVVTGHRPIYSDKHVDSHGNPTGDSQRLQAAIEDLLMKYGVDLYIAGEWVWGWAVRAERTCVVEPPS